jgi:hypothetical protein
MALELESEDYQFTFLDEKYPRWKSCAIVALKVLSDENQGGSKLVSIDSFFFTV